MAKRYERPAPAGLAAVIRETREAHDLTQRQLAGLIGRTQSHISLVEGGSGTTTARTLDSIAFQMDCRWALIPLEDSHAQD